MIPVALTIAGSDPSGGAGIQADLKTFHQHKVYGTSVLSMLTAQNTQRVDAVEVLDPTFVIRQLEAVLDDVPPAAAKTGALGNAAVIETLAAALEGIDFPLVVDPVIVSKHGETLMDDEGIKALREHLLPRATLVTPNRYETRALVGIDAVDEASAERAATAFGELGCPHVLVKGLRRESLIWDVLWSPGGDVERYEGPLIETERLHGSGCVFSAAICAELALGKVLDEAVAAARRFITLAISEAPQRGKGISPVTTHVAVL